MSRTPPRPTPIDRTPNHADRLWTVEDTSAFLGIPVATLYQWRHRSLGPRAYKVGRHLRYDPADVRQWLDGRAA
ncbi:MAG: helix-turn-helix domain-containing protein [Pseudonocardia sp.]|nr:helix-turn-helix domain-containing protein [Pseudonocardia sp.]